jgi:hypothetical protein
LWQLLQGLTAGLDHGNEDPESVVYGSLAKLKDTGVELILDMAKDGRKHLQREKVQITDGDIVLGRGLLAEICG